MGKQLSFAVLSVAVLAMLLVVGSMTHEDAQAERAFYCAMVETGDWPDYKGIAKGECRAIVEKD